MINKTEALTIIDINSSKTAKDKFEKINDQAIHEAYRQIILKNLNGIIIIDFINNIQEKQEFKKFFKDKFSKDDRITKIDFVKGSIIAIIFRKSEGKDILKEFSLKCEGCAGTGFKKSSAFEEEKIEDEILMAINNPEMKDIEIKFESLEAMKDFLNKKQALIRRCINNNIRIRWVTN